VSCIAIVPARGGSTRIPRKNVREFRGQPMMLWPIATAMASMLFDDVVVSTDDVEIARIARSAGCSLHWRAHDDGSRGTQQIAADVLEDSRCTNACVIYPCAPMLRAADLQNGYMQLADRPDNAFAMSVLTNPLADAGMFYWGRRWAFVNGAPLVYWHTAMIPIHPSRGIDINTMQDWARAEEMFDHLREGRDHDEE
jgi:N-acylneuraminate cytidylyltransferase